MIYTNIYRILDRLTRLYIMPILFSFGICSIPLAIIGLNPIVVYSRLVFGAFRDRYWISELILKITPLLMCSLAVGLSLRVSFWNIGVEGQFLIGAWASGGIALTFGYFSKYVLIPLMMVAGFISGALWISVPAILKTKLKVNEIITTLLMNYIASLWLNHFVYGKWKGADGFPYTEKFSESAYLPGLIGQRMHIGIFFGICIVAVFYLIFKKTRFGYEARVVGESVKAAKYGGINTNMVILIIALASAGIAGFAGMIDVSGIHHRLHPNILLGYGYTGIIIAWLSKNDPIIILLVSALFGILAVGGDIIQVLQVPNSIVRILQAIIFLSFLVADKLFSHSSKAY